MKGTHSITVGNNMLQYKFELHRNITIIKGDSATGKTTLVDMIREYDQAGEQSGVSLQCDKACIVLEGRQWKLLLENMHDSIVFIDEGNAFVASVEFAEAVKNSDNYYVIVTRENLPTLPYSADEVYGIKLSGKYGSLKKCFQEFYKIYDINDKTNWNKTDVVIVEDSNAGYEFFRHISESKAWKIYSAGGKTKIHKTFSSFREEKIVVIADGAAFGSEMDKVTKYMEFNDNIRLYLPESFEWLILKSGVIKSGEIKRILENPSDYIASEEFMSWERFFTKLLMEKSAGTYLQYSKSKLNESYKSDTIVEKIIDYIPDGIIN